MAIKSVSIRIEEEMLEKLGFVADYAGRSINSHILVLIRKSIQSFEQQHGEIDGTIRPDVNVKPTRKNLFFQETARTVSFLLSKLRLTMHINLFPGHQCYSNITIPGQRTGVCAPCDCPYSSSGLSGSFCSFVGFVDGRFQADR